MTPLQKQFCEDVKQACTVWNTYHPDFKLPANLKEMQQKAEEKYRKTVPMTDEVHLEYFKTANKILKIVSGVGVPEPVGTGDPEADFERAMKIIG